MSSTGTRPSPPFDEAPPGAWPAARAAARRLLSPVDSFLSVEAASGVLLLLAAVVALIWANSPWRWLYEALLHTPLGIKLGGFSFERDLHFWINDGLMVVFFFVVGLEIKRELHGGELRTLQRAALPAIAALGGMLVPAGIYVLFNAGAPAAGGWGVPVATDIAFAVGVLALLGKRAPPALRVLLLALAVIDDLGAILVIAIFYSAGFSAVGLAVAVGGLGLIVAMQKLGIRTPWAYVLPGVVVWAGVLATGIHPTIAGVAIGLMTPVRAWFGAERFAAHASATLDEVKETNGGPDTGRLLSTLAQLSTAQREAVSPLARLEHDLHGLVAFGIMPLFALANAGVAFSGARLEGGGGLALLGVVLGLALGKPVGIVTFAWLSVRLGIATLPAGIRWSGMLVLGLVGGIGFTMALFIASLALPDGPLLDAAKLGILAASTIAALAGLSAGRLVLPKPAS
jgi:NhaA family Na+:H+ antiporter